MELSVTSLYKTSIRDAASRHFGRAVVISLTCHVLFAMVVLLSPKGGPYTSFSSITEVDLTMIPAPDICQQQPAATLQHVSEPQTMTEEPAEAEQDSPPAVQEPLPAPPAQLPRSTLGIGLASGFFASFSEGESLHTELREYYLEMLRQINEEWWQSAGSLTGAVRGAMVIILVAPNGEIVQKRLVVSSGSRSVDRAILQAVDRSAPLPPLPSSFAGDIFEAPLRFNPPLTLLSLG